MPDDARDNPDKEENINWMGAVRAAGKAWGRSSSRRASPQKAQSTGSVRLTPQDVDAAQRTEELHEDEHKEERRRYVERMKMLLAPLSEGEWSEIKAHRDSKLED